MIGAAVALVLSAACAEKPAAVVEYTAPIGPTQSGAPMQSEIIPGAVTP